MSSECGRMEREAGCLGMIRRERVVEGKGWKEDGERGGKVADFSSGIHKKHSSDREDSVMAIQARNPMYSPVRFEVVRVDFELLPILTDELDVGGGVGVFWHERLRGRWVVDGSSALHRCCPDGDGRLERWVDDLRLWDEV